MEPTALWVVPVPDLGGVARHVLDVARHGIPGWRLVVLCPSGPLAEELRGLGAAVMTGPLGPDHGVARSVATVRHALRSLRPRVVHSHLSYADVVVGLATVGDPAALITTEHGIAADDLVYHGTPWRARLKAGVHTARLRRVDALIAVSESTADVVRAKWRPGSEVVVRVILNGVDRLRPAPVRAPGLHICSLARLAPEKRIDALLRAFALVHAKHPQARLTVAGRGPLESELKGLTADLGLTDAVDFPGHVDPAALLAEADVLAQLSVWENASYSLLDAVVHGLGVVATPVGGNPEIVQRQALVDADDTAEVARVLLDQGLNLSSRGTLAKEWPTIGDMCEAIAAVYGEVTS